ncbi:hypothetical protein [Plastoroseomonas hellenica]|nr:hypothetical protein [Plastoroseomonas hellenica]MBR0642632.1 hypothetical protein [Plastoroseomonas hellenica]
MTRVGIIGAGHIRQAVARLATAAGHDELNTIAARLGSGAAIEVALQPSP